MTNASTIAQAAVSAQRNLHDVAAHERALRRHGHLGAAAAIGIYRGAERRRLELCAVQFAALVPANDGAFTPAPEPELA